MQNALVVRDAPDPARWAKEAEAWLTGYLSRHTQRAYAEAWRAFNAHVARHPWEVEQQDVIGWRDAMKAAGLDDATVCARLTAISSFYRRAIEKGLTDANPTVGVQRPKVTPYGKVHAPALSAVPLAPVSNTRDRALLMLLLLLGLRRAELLGLRRRDVIEHPDGTMSIRYKPKGKAEDDRDIDPACAAALRAYLVERGDLEPDAPVFPITADGLRYVTKKYFGCAPHAVRHAAASALYEATGRPRDVQELLGHTRLATTQIYVEALQADNRAALGAILAARFGL